MYRYCLADIAKGIFNGMIGNYLLYFFQPTAKSGLPALLPENKLLGFITIMALITGLGKIVDAVTDPLVAALSDKCTHKAGRRIPFLRYAAIPYAVSVLLIFYAPFPEGSFANALWVGLFLIAYYTAYTFFFIPRNALVPEIIPDSKVRVGYYGISTAFFMGSSSFMYAATLFVNLLKNAGLSPLWAWRTVFTVFSAIAAACLLLSAYAFEEKDYATGNVKPKESLLCSFRQVFQNRNFLCFTTDPFCATVKDGALWGRGTVDTKTPLFAELQAAEELLSEGYDFEGITLYIGSSHNEEVSGDGMVLAAEYFRNQGIRFDVILDEGGAITTGMIPGVTAKSAVVAVHEKGRHLYRCTVRENREGHGGLNPTTGSPVAALSEFITRISKSKIFKASFAPEVKATFTRHAPYMAFPLNLVFGNFSLFSPIIKMIMGKIPQASAMISTGVTFTTFHAGSEESPQAKAKEAEAYMFLRCVREENLQREMDAVREIAAEYGVEIQEVMRDYCRPSTFDAPPFQVLERILHENFPDVIVAPFLLTAGTDARRFTDLADCILRFAPIDLSKQQFSSIHGKNENITIQNIGECVLFYRDFIKKI